MNSLNDEDIRSQTAELFLNFEFSKQTELQNIVDLASQLCDKPVALLTLLGKEINWIRVAVGFQTKPMPRETSFCQFAIQKSEVMIVSDASQDPRFNDNPLVQSSPHVRFYAGAPLILNDGLKIGTLCLFDLKPSTMSELQERTLLTLSKQVTALLELDLSRFLLEKQIAETVTKNESLKKIAFMQSHEIRHPLSNIIGLVNLVRDGVAEVDENWLTLLGEETHNLDSKIKDIVMESLAIKDLKALRYQKMVEEIEDYAILILDEKGYIENWNRGAEKLKGYKANEIIGQNFSIFYSGQDQLEKRHLNLIEEASQQGTARDTGWRVRKDATQFWGQVTITAIHDYDGKVIGFTKVTKDLSNTIISKFC
ncbi:PAS domain S-box protein [Dyadobacter psychrotolerans]|uniref:histidine kinase n=1 Tax=Dyadobacter psychrotolerans TaxID=2541721 RepID=A0A4R5DAL1_9BACT|nr:PAS domain S-box protein [Dyadobacter psychrotolerans]TDE09000.1 PAS domain S-box protein [Dyadobacter psychrotolerans]